MADRPLALVTGSVRRIGRAIVEDLSRHGFDVALHCHGSRDEADVIAASLSQNGARVEVFGGDLTVAGAGAALIGDVTAAMGPLELLINNASIFEDDEMGTLGEAQFDLHFVVYPRGYVNCSGTLRANELVPLTGWTWLFNNLASTITPLTLDRLFHHPKHRLYTTLYPTCPTAIWTSCNIMRVFSPSPLAVTTNSLSIVDNFFFYSCICLSESECESYFEILTDFSPTRSTSGVKSSSKK